MLTAPWARPCAVKLRNAHLASGPWSEAAGADGSLVSSATANESSVCVFLSSQAQFAGTRRGHILLSAPTIPVVSIPADGTRDKALKLLGCRCFSLFGVTVSRLRLAGTVTPTDSCANGAGLFCGGSLWFLEMGSFSFLQPLPTAHCSLHPEAAWLEKTQLETSSLLCAL